MKTPKTSLKSTSSDLSTFRELKRIFIRHTEPWEFTEANNQNLESYTLLTEHLSQVVGVNQFNDIFDIQVFDKATKRTKIKLNLVFALRAVFMISFSLAVLILATTFRNINLLGIVTLLALAISVTITAAFLSRFTMQRLGLSSAEVAASSKNPEQAIKIISELDDNIFGKYNFYFVDQNGTIYELPKNLYRADNALLFFLGETKHRDAVPFNGSPPERDIYISKAKPTRDTRNPDVIKGCISNKELISDLLQLVQTHHPFDPAKPKEKLTLARNRWVRALRYIHDNWDKWESYQSRTGGNKETRNELINRLQIRGKSRAEMDKILNDFTDGKNKYFGYWLAQLGFIDSQTYAISSNYRNISDT